jgi:hypothetical protein
LVFDFLRISVIMPPNKSPNSKSPFNGVIEIVEQSRGTVKPIIDVTYPDKSKGRITEDTISEKMDMEFSGDNLQEAEELVNKGKLIENINFVSEGNAQIYERYKSKIVKFLLK